MPKRVLVLMTINWRAGRGDSLKVNECVLEVLRVEHEA